MFSALHTTPVNVIWRMFEQREVCCVNRDMTDFEREYAMGKFKPNYPMPTTLSNADTSTLWIVLNVMHKGCKMCLDDWCDSLTWDY